MLPYPVLRKQQEPPLPEYADFIVRCTVFAAAHSLFASARVKKLFGRHAGTEPRFYRLIYNLASLAMFGWVMAAYRNSPLLYAVPGVWKWVLHAGQFAAAAAAVLCLRQTGSADFLGISSFHTSSTHIRRLVTDGCYARVRHPLYLFSALFLLLNPVMSAQWALLSVFSLTYFIIGGIIEERRLLEEFGEQYRKYRDSVPFLIPSLKCLPQRTGGL